MAMVLKGQRRLGVEGRHDSCHHLLRGLDYAIQMAFSNFSASLFHVTVGGQNVFIIHSLIRYIVYKG